MVVNEELAQRWATSEDDAELFFEEAEYAGVDGAI